MFQQRRKAKTKIICTLGPASTHQTVLRKMMLAGMDVVRLNFSHGSLAHRLARIRTIRQLNQKYRRSIKILGDLEGHRIRIGRLKSPLHLKKRAKLWLTQKDVIGQGDLAPFDYSGSLKPIKKGQLIFIEDGNICLKVLSRSRNELKTEVLVAGILKQHKGVNLPGARLTFPGLSPKDRADIKFCLEQELDFIAQSFVRQPADILAIRRLVKRSNTKLIAKIENRDGIKNIDSIISVSDGIMIARGDMGISIPLYEVPIVQKRIIKKCNQARKLVITATQMLESMTENHLPTRAEVTDVANAVLDGTDYVMLSGETAVGQYPVETVMTMDQIIKYTEYHAK